MDWIIQKLSVFERRMLRKIFGPTEEFNGIWRIKANKELDELIKHRNINYVKAQRLSWFGHTNRMPETSLVKRIHKWNPFTGRPAGRPSLDGMMISGMIWRRQSLWSGQNKYRNVLNGRILSGRPRLYKSCSAIEEERWNSICEHHECIWKSGGISPLITQHYIKYSG